MVAYVPLGIRTPSRNSRRTDPLPSRIKSLRACCVAICGCKLTCSRLQDYSEGWSKSSRLAPISRHFLLTFLVWTTDTQCCSPKPHGSRLRANTFLNNTFPHQKQVFVIRYHWQGGSRFAVRPLSSGRTPSAKEKKLGHVFLEYFLEHRSYQHRWNTAANTPKQLPSS